MINDDICSRNEIKYLLSCKSLCRVPPTWSFPLLCRSCRIFDLHDLFGHPFPLLPSAVIQSKALRAECSGAMQITCPKDRNLLAVTMSCIRLCFVLASSCAFFILFLHVTPMILRGILSWNTSYFFLLIRIVLFHVDTTTADRYIWYS